MKVFWKKTIVREYILTKLFDIDEIVRKYGGCPNDEEYIITRSYYYWEWQGDEKWELVSTNKEDYDNNFENEEFNYGTDLNYKEFEDKFWHSEFEDFLLGKIEIINRNNFLEEVTDTFYELKFEGQAKFFLREVIECLQSAIRQLNRISKYKKEINGIEVNEIQQFVIKTYIESYNDSINEIINDFNIVYAEIENLKNYSIKKTFKEIEEEQYIDKIWFKVGCKFADGEIFNLIKINKSYKEISRILFNENDKYSNYISQTLSEKPSSNTDKCIFKSNYKMEKIISYFKNNNLIIDNRFMEKYKQIKNCY